ncbi:RNA-binding protein [Candidatus Babeliales bacterium]|nr:RNA-binding protein [Candidatus Babeliales bacterium]
MNIYVGNLSYDVTEEELKEKFEAFGPVVSARIITDKFSGKPKGFAFVEMANQNDAQSAVDGLDGQELKGRKLKVNKAHDRPSRPPRGSFGGPSAGGSRGRGRY